MAYPTKWVPETDARNAKDLGLFLENIIPELRRDDQIVKLILSDIGLMIVYNLPKSPSLIHLNRGG